MLRVGEDPSKARLQTTKDWVRESGLCALSKDITAMENNKYGLGIKVCIQALFLALALSFPTQDICRRFSLI